MRTVIVVAALLASMLKAEVFGSTSIPSPKRSSEPTFLTRLVAAHWQLAIAHGAFSQAPLVQPENLEFQDFVQYVLDRGAVRLCVGAGLGDRVFAMLVDTSRPPYHAFTNLTSTADYTTYHHGPYVLVIPIRSIRSALMDRLTTRRWSEADLHRILGPPSYHWHVHGVGYFGLTYVPYGLSFVGDWQERGKPLITYQLVANKPGYDEDGLAPLASLSKTQFVRLQQQGRETFANQFLSQREQIDQALASGMPSPDGRFVVNNINLGGLANTEEVVIWERDEAERRYHAPHFTDEKNYRWLDDHTILFEVTAVQISRGPVGRGLIFQAHLDGFGTFR